MTGSNDRMSLSGVPCRKVLWLFAAFSFLILLLFFFHLPENALITMDASLAGMKNLHEMIIHGRLMEWNGDYWLGSPGAVLYPSVHLPILGLFPIPYGTTALLGTGIFLGGLAMFCLLCSLELSTWACIFGGGSMLLTNTVFTLALPGHINKVYSYPWLIFACAFFLRGLQDLRWKNFAITGAFLGISVLSGEFQVAFYLGLWFLVWTLLTAIQRRREGNLPIQLLRYAAALLLLVGITILMAFQTLAGIFDVVSNTSAAVGEGSSPTNWAFATQFYFPPEELLSYLTTIQFFGAPQAYWGRDGNPTPLRLSDDYMGLLPLGFAILGGIACWRIWQVRLFIITAIASLLISFGREGGLYWLLYQLPTMKSQRNPHRWSYFVSLAVCVLAAYGVDWLWKQMGSEGGSERPHSNKPDWKKWQKNMAWIALGGGILFVFTGFMLMNGRGVAGSFYSKSALLSSQGGLCLERTRMLLASLTRTGLFLALSAGSVWWLIRTNVGDRASSLERRACWGALILVLLLDLGTNAKRYIIFLPWKEHLENNALANLLRKDQDFYRVKVLDFQASPLLNDLVLNVLPFNYISVVDPHTMIRLPSDYGALLNYFNHHPVRTDRYFDFFNVKYVVTPRPISDPYVSLKPLAVWEGINVYLRENSMPRAWLAFKAKVVADGDEAVLAATFHPSLNLRETVVLEEKLSSLPTLEKPLGFKLRASGSPPSAQIIHYEDNRIEIKTNSEAPAILVLDEKWDPDWKAWLDEKPVKIHKANFLMRGVEVPSGSHHILMEYQPSKMAFSISAFFVIIFVLYGFSFLFRPEKSVGA